jgi:hypothetical protein
MSPDTAEESYEQIYRKISFDEMLNKNHCLPQIQTQCSQPTDHINK